MMLLGFCIFAKLYFKVLLKLQSTFKSTISLKFVFGGQSIGFRMTFHPKKILEKEWRLREKWWYDVLLRSLWPISKMFCNFSLKLNIGKCISDWETWEQIKLAKYNACNCLSCSFQQLIQMLIFTLSTIHSIWK